MHPPDTLRDRTQDNRPQRAKLSPENVLEIRCAYAAGRESAAALARRFGVTWATIQGATSGRSWKQVGGPVGSEGFGKASGERIGKAKLNAAKVAEIRLAYGEGRESAASLARRFSVWVGTVYKVMREKPGSMRKVL